MEALFKNPGDRVAVHPVLHVYVHCVLYENEISGLVPRAT
jgi:hypothetical protein